MMVRNRYALMFLAGYFLFSNALAQTRLKPIGIGPLPPSVAQAPEIEELDIQTGAVAPPSSAQRKIEAITVTKVPGHMQTGPSIKSEPLPIQMVKTVALDRNCDGIADGKFQTTSIEAGNGQCMLWRIEVSNEGSETLCNVQVNDVTQTDLTTLSLRPFIFSQPRPGTGSCSVQDGMLQCFVGNPVDSNKDGVSEKYCLKQHELAEIRYGVLVR